VAVCHLSDSSRRTGASQSSRQVPRKLLGSRFFARSDIMTLSTFPIDSYLEFYCRFSSRYAHRGLCFRSGIVGGIAGYHSCSHGLWPFGRQKRPSQSQEFFQVSNPDFQKYAGVGYGCIFFHRTSCTFEGAFRIGLAIYRAAGAREVTSRTLWQILPSVQCPRQYPRPRPTFSKSFGDERK
jgi:hypothetical protein